MYTNFSSCDGSQWDTTFIPVAVNVCGFDYVCDDEMEWRSGLKKTHRCWHLKMESVTGASSYCCYDACAYVSFFLFSSFAHSRKIPRANAGVGRANRRREKKTFITRRRL